MVPGVSAFSSHRPKMRRGRGRGDERGNRMVRMRVEVSTPALSPLLPYSEGLARVSLSGSPGLSLTESVMVD